VVTQDVDARGVDGHVDIGTYLRQCAAANLEFKLDARLRQHLDADVVAVKSARRDLALNGSI
jgi:hypothetical protein